MPSGSKLTEVFHDGISGPIPVPRPWQAWLAEKSRNIHLASQEERARVCNGCGPKGMDIFPDFIWEQDCDWHDWLYAIGGDDKDRKLADRWFWYLMRVRVRTRAWWRRPLLYLMAWRGYRAVRHWGKVSGAWTATL